MKFIDLCRNYTATTGAAPFTLEAAVQGFDSIAAKIAVGESFYYSCVGIDNPTEKETGVGTKQVDGTISRTPTGGVATNFSVGVKSIALVVNATFFQRLDDFINKSSLRVFRPEDYGAKGLGNPANDDGPALALLSAAVNAADGGLVVCPPGAVYYIGTQVATPGNQAVPYGYSFPGTTRNPLNFENCTGALVLQLNGAKFKCISGAKYGTFYDNGNPKPGLTPPTAGGLASPYDAMIRVSGCSGGIYVGATELDGSIGSAVIGGEFNDTGRQISKVGLFLQSNPCQVVVQQLKSHHHGLDGLELIWADVTESSPTYPIFLLSCEMLNNGRQACSWVGGKGVTAIRCKFNSTGKDTGDLPPSAPAAGLDIEAEASICRDGHFIDCEFADNSGSGTTHVGDVADILYDHSKLIGTTNWAAWTPTPRTRFNHCLIVGAITNPFQSTERSEATQFHQCKFSAGTQYHPAGTVYLPVDNYLLNFGGGAQNVLFNQCKVDTEGHATAKLGIVSQAIYQDCEFIQDAVGVAYLGGKHFGYSTIMTAGSADTAYGADYGLYGRLVVNGVDQPRTIPGDLSLLGNLKMVSGKGIYAGAKLLAVVSSDGTIVLPGTIVQFQDPTASANWFMRALGGNLYVTDGAGNQVQRWETDGVHITGVGAFSGAVTGSNLSGTNTGDQYGAIAQATFVGRASGAGVGPATALTVAQAKTSLALAKADVGLGSVDNTADAAKNVLTATKLVTARTINGVPFDGSGNITINAVDATARLAAGLVSAYGLTLIDDADAATARATLGLGSNATDSTARAPAARSIGTTAPLTGGGDLTADRTIGMPAATAAVDGYMTAVFATKLNGIAAGATANSSDATLLARANHTGTQAVSTILAAATSVIFGRASAGGGAGEELTVAQVAAMVGSSSRWENIVMGSGTITAAVTSSAKYFASNGQALVASGGAAAAVTPIGVYIDAADFPAIGTLTAKLRIRFLLHTNDVAPGGNFTVGLYPVTRPATSGAAGAIIFTLGVAIATAVINAPAADGSYTVVSAEVAIPADGYYALGVLNSATLAASSFVAMEAILQSRYS